MTPGNNGASTPEDDDPFGYLYADGQANGAQPPSGGYGYPNSVNRVRPVGTRQYGQQTFAAQAPPQGAYGQPSAHYAAPETLPGATTTQSPQPGHGGRGGRGGSRGRGPNTRGLLVGAIAVLAAVVIGIGVAMVSGDDEDGGGSQADSTPTQGQNDTEPSPSGSKSAEDEVELPTIDAKALRLDGGAALASDVEGAQSDGGIYVTNLNQPGSTVTWTVNGIPKDGAYTVFVRYSTTDDPQSMTLTVNGKPFGTKLNMDNWAGAKDGDFSKGWTKTFAWPTLNKGTNTISVSCADGDKCNVLLDQLWLKQGRVKD
ncbi:carbohydrate-binding protein [Streptomyces sp. NPDC016640]|uniref:carbohydrate-binding protein n=1 Tax=Streptomyces sp. NPDC016640 TaxID=3364969 RepID=UPI0036F59042